MIILLGTLLLGAILGAVGGLLGIGGAIIAIPILGMIFGMDQHMAQGTALVMMTPNVIMSFWRYWQRNPFSLATASLTGLTAVLATYPAAKLAILLPSHTLKLAFAIFMVGLAIYFIVNSIKPATAPRTAYFSDRYLPLVGIIGGVFSGIFSVGAGIVAAPILVKAFGKKQAVAQGLALALVVPGALVALATYAHAKHVDWPIGIALAIGGICTVSKGVAWAHELPDNRLKQLFAVMLLMTAGLMIKTSL